MKLFISMLLASVMVPTLAFAGEPVNSICPFTGKAVNPAVTATVGEDTVAFCCGGCLGGFNKWDTERQLTYIAEQKAQNSAPPATEEAAVELAVQTPYLLDTCPITGKKLDAMGGEVVEVIDGREVRFCCAGCPPQFKKNKAKMFKKIDALMIKNQLPYYPITTCIVSGDDLDVHDSPTDFIYGNRLFRTCCNDCKGELISNPEKYVPELDEAIIKAQKDSYPLTTCIIGKGPLEAMGGPEDVIVGNRLVRLCCGGCTPKLLKDPLAVFAELDAAKK